MHDDLNTILKQYVTSDGDWSVGNIENRVVENPFFGMWTNFLNEKETEMKKVVEHKTYVFGVDIAEADESQLISLIEKLNSEKKHLDDLEVDSDFIESRINSIEEAIELVIEKLDS